MMRRRRRPWRRSNGWLAGLAPLAAAVVFAIVVVAGEAGAAQMTLRGDQLAPPGEITRVQPTGILLAPIDDEGSRSAGPGRAFIEIGWDHIRHVEGAFAQEAEPFMEIADRAWRARTRLERGDALGAEPLLEELFEEYRDAKGATAAMVAEGLLRCRLRRGAHIAAIEPWLKALEARGSVPAYRPDWALEAGMPPIIDESTGLAPALPPIWLSLPAVDALARNGLSASGNSANGPIVDRGQALAALYVHAARMQVGVPTSLPDVRSSDPGVRLVLAIVQSQSDDPDQRHRARLRLGDWLRARSPTSPPTPAWIEIWCRAAIGRSLLRESSLDLRRSGVLELLHLPARFASAHPYLAGLAVAEASVALRQMGDDASADILRRELLEHFPAHPAHNWDALRSASAEGTLPAIFVTESHTSELFRPARPFHLAKGAPE